MGGRERKQSSSSVSLSISSVVPREKEESKGGDEGRQPRQEGGREGGGEQR